MSDFLIIKSFNSALDHLSDRDRSFIRHRFRDPVMWAFFDAQIIEARRQMDELDPSHIKTEDAAAYLMAAKEARFVYQFWVELAAYVKDWALTEGE